MFITKPATFVISASAALFILTACGDSKPTAAATKPIVAQPVKPVPVPTKLPVTQLKTEVKTLTEVELAAAAAARAEEREQQEALSLRKQDELEVLNKKEEAEMLAASQANTRAALARKSKDDALKIEPEALSIDQLSSLLKKK